jgi:hypothetical protein
LATKKNLEIVRKLYEENSNLLVSAVAKKIKASNSILCRIKVQKLGIKKYCKIPALLYRGNQEKRAKTNCRKIYRNKLSSKPGKILVIDDETYLSIDPTQLTGKGHYH